MQNTTTGRPTGSTAGNAADGLVASRRATGGRVLSSWTALGRGRDRRRPRLCATVLVVLLGLALPAPAGAAPGGSTSAPAVGSVAAATMSAGATTTSGAVVTSGPKALDRRSKRAFEVRVRGLTRTAATASLTAAQDAVTHYRFDHGTQGWQGENVVLGHDRTTKAEGTGSLRLTRSVSSSWTALRANDGRSSLRDVRADGDTFSAWVLVPSGTAGTWRARVEVQDVDYRYHGGAARALTPGRWQLVEAQIAPDVARQARAFAVQVEVTGGRGTARVNVDSFSQRHSTPTATPSPSPSPSPTPSPSPSPSPSPTPTQSPSPSASPSPTPTVSGLRAVGGKVVDASDKQVRLLGANTAGTEYACAQGWGFFDSPTINTPNATVVGGMRAWGATAVRVPMNEHCWLDIDSGIPAERRGQEYRAAITDHVRIINDAGMVAILDLHWHAPGTRRTDNNPMANRDNSPRFWASVASHFKDNDDVVFELVNEPHPDGGSNSAEAWRCWRDGGTCGNTVDIATGQPYVTAGMQELLDAVRGTGADQLVLVGGVQWTNRLSGWLENRPHDPMGNIGVAWHAYNFNSCITSTCWDGEVTPVADRFPLVVTELGPDQSCLTCAPSPTGFSERLLDFLDGRGASYTAWTWNRWSGDPHVLVTDWAGTQPTPWGQQVKTRLVRATSSF